MKRVTLSLEPHHVDLLEDLGDEWDESSRSAAARRLIEEYEERMNSSYDSSHDVHTEFTRRLDRLEDRVDALEAGDRADDDEEKLADRAREVREADADELQDLIDEAEDADPTESPQSTAEREEATGDVEVAASAPRSEAHSERDDVVRAVEQVAESWSDDPDRLEARKEAAAAVLTAAVEGRPIGRSEAVDRFYEEYSVAGQNERTWYRKNVRPVLSEFGSYSQGQQGYVVDELPTG